MFAIQPGDNAKCPSPGDPLDLFPLTPTIQGNDLPALITDFFDWLETEWQLPVFAPDVERPSFPPPLMLADDLCTNADLMRLCGCSFGAVNDFLAERGIFPSDFVCLSGTKRRCKAYSKQELAPFLEQWNWKRLAQVLDQWWLRFFPPAFGICFHCQMGQKSTSSPQALQLRCGSHIALNQLRSIFLRFLKEIKRLGKVTALWRAHRTDTLGKTTHSAVGFLLIYLLDRPLLHLAFDGLLEFTPLTDKSLRDLARLWRNRRPDEYIQFQQSMNAASYTRARIQNRGLMRLTLLIL